MQLFEEAEPLCRRALRKREEHFGEEHRDTLTSAAYRDRGKKHGHRGEQLGLPPQGQEAVP